MKLIFKLVVALVALSVGVISAMIQPAPDSDVPLVVINDANDGVQVANPADGTVWQVWYAAEQVVGVKDGCLMTYWYGKVRQHQLFSVSPQAEDLSLLPHGATLIAPSSDPCQMMVQDRHANFYVADACRDQLMGVGEAVDGGVYWDTSGDQVAYSSCQNVFVTDVHQNTTAHIAEGQMVPFGQGATPHNSVVIEGAAGYDLVSLDDHTVLHILDKAPDMIAFTLHDATTDGVFYEVVTPYYTHTLYRYDARNHTTTTIFADNDPLLVYAASATDGVILFGTLSDTDLRVYSVADGLQTIALGTSSRPTVNAYPSGYYVGTTERVGTIETHHIRQLDVADGTLHDVYCGDPVEVDEITDEWLMGLNDLSQPFVMRRSDGETFTVDVDDCEMVSLDLYPSVPQRSAIPYLLMGSLFAGLAVLELTLCRWLSRRTRLC